MQNSSPAVNKKLVKVLHSIKSHLQEIVLKLHNLGHPNIRKRGTKCGVTTEIMNSNSKARKWKGKKCLNGRSLDSFQLCLLTLQYVLFYESKVQFEVQISNKITQPQPGGAYWGRGDLSQLIFVCCIQKVAKTSLYVPP